MSIEQNVLSLISGKGYKPLKFRELADALGISKDERTELKTVLAELIAGGKLSQHANGAYPAATGPGLIAGVVKRLGSGSGVFRPHDAAPGTKEDEIRIDRPDMLDAASGDEVLVRLRKKRGAKGIRLGEVVEVIERQTSTFVGTYFENLGQGYVQIDGRTFNEPVSVGDPGAKGAKPDDKVVFEMLRFPAPRRPGEGVITHVLGPRGETEVDTLSVIYSFGLPFEFDDAVHDDARGQADRFNEEDLSDREDLTGETIITIDPVDARDFDDAISLKTLEGGHWELGVHIADVAHFVRPRSPLDVEAQRRGTSVYLPRKVIPMLPELISNGLASLQEGKLRYTKSVFIEFTPDGAPVSARLSNSAIKVKKRFAYEEVLPLLDSGDNGRKLVGHEIYELVSQMQKLARILRKRRHDKGMLELNIGEVKLDFDQGDKVIGAHDVVHDESHQMIEEFMLAANIAVARELTDRQILFLRRVHADPDEIKLRAFAEFVQSMDFNLQQYQSRTELQKLLKQVEGQPTERAISYALLRSMKQAEYTRFEIGHYALAEEHYCHFTSPIRRYPDLTVHRIVDAIVRKRRRPKETNEEELIRLGKHCSQTERRAAQSERELTRLKLLRFMETRVGEEMHAIITGVENFGMFCQGLEIPVEGLVHIRRLERREHFDFDGKARSLVGRSTGMRYRLGDQVHVKVAAVDIDRRELDFDVLTVERKPKKGEKQQGHQKNKSKNKNKPKQHSPQVADSEQKPKKKKNRRNPRKRKNKDRNPK